MYLIVKYYVWNANLILITNIEINIFHLLSDNFVFVKFIIKLTITK